jgi:hypothetical protein
MVGAPTKSHHQRTDGCRLHRLLGSPGYVHLPENLFQHSLRPRNVPGMLQPPSEEVSTLNYKDTESDTIIFLINISKISGSRC